MVWHPVMTERKDFPMSIQTQPTNATPVLPSLPEHQATDLTGNGPTALIRLDDKVYTLRITRAGKLILTK